MVFKRVVLQALLPCLIVFSVASAAYSKSSTIHLGTYHAGPRETINIDFSSLASNIYYKLTCQARNDNPNPESKLTYIKTWVGKLDETTHTRLYIDHEIANPQKAVAFNSNGSVLEIAYVTKEMINVGFENLDSTDTISMSDCIAELGY